jgi:hypothetical protein
MNVLSCTSARQENLTWLKIGTGLSQKWEHDNYKPHAKNYLNLSMFTKVIA